VPLRDLNKSCIVGTVSSGDDPAHPPDLAGALHEVSNALTVILGWIGRAHDAKDDPEKLQRALAIAGARASLARRIVRRAITTGAEGAFVADDDAMTEPDVRPTRSIVDDAILGIDPELKRAALHVEITLESSLDALHLEGAQAVLQILTNLLLNAIAFSPQNGTIRVDGRAGHGQRVILSVADDGPGIAPERRSTLLTSGETTRPGGAGVGLRHARALASASGGELALVDSERGARFELAWPGRERAKPSVPPPPRIGISIKGARVLVVEDDEAVIDLLDTALGARGADIVSVRRLEDLPAALATGHFDAALFDMSPIQRDVVGALRAAREANDAHLITTGSAGRHLRVVFISGSAAAIPALPAGWVSSWVRKPFEVGEIVRAIENE
jgi:CheY-like chemotaxis protein